MARLMFMFCSACGPAFVGTLCQACNLCEAQHPSRIEQTQLIRIG